MAYPHEELAQAFVKQPVEVFGVYRTEMEASAIYDGHVDRPTTKCAVIISLRGQAEFIFNETERFLLEPGKILLGGMQKKTLPAATDQWENSEVWKKLKAVANNHVYSINGELALGYGPIGNSYGVQAVLEALQK